MITEDGKNNSPLAINFIQLLIDNNVFIITDIDQLSTDKEDKLSMITDDDQLLTDEESMITDIDHISTDKEDNLLMITDYNQFYTDVKNSSSMIADSDYQCTNEEKSSINSRIDESSANNSSESSKNNNGISKLLCN